MRIIHLLNHCRFGHGNVHAALDLACAQAAQGDAVYLACAGGEFEPLLKKCGVGFALIDQENRKPWRVAKAQWQLHRLIRRFKPDVLHAHMMTGAVLGAVESRLTGIPLVTTVHNAFEKHAIIMKLGQRVVAVSDPVREHMEGRGVSPSRLRTVLNGTLGAARREFFPSKPLTWPRPSLTTICGLHPRKGIVDLLHAFDMVAKVHPQAILNLVGDGPNRAEYEAVARSLPSHSQIRFHGQLHDTKSVLSQTDIFVLASHNDPCPLAVPEAREAGCAIVATAVDGIPQALDGGEAGLLVPKQDPAAFAAAVLRLLDDPTLLAQMKKYAQRNLEFWSASRVANQTRDVYTELLPHSGLKGSRKALGDTAQA